MSENDIARLVVWLEDWTKPGPWTLPWVESQMPEVYLLTLTCGYCLETDTSGRCLHPGHCQQRCGRERAMIAVGPNVPGESWLVVASAPMARTILDQDDAELSKGAPLDPWYLLNRPAPAGAEHHMWVGPTTGSVEVAGPWKIKLRGCLEHPTTPQADLVTVGLYRTVRRLQATVDVHELPLSGLQAVYDNVMRGA